MRRDGPGTGQDAAMHEVVELLTTGTRHLLDLEPQGVPGPNSNDDGPSSTLPPMSGVPQAPGGHRQLEEKRPRCRTSGALPGLNALDSPGAGRWTPRGVAAFDEFTRQGDPHCSGNWHAPIDLSCGWPSDLPDSQHGDRLTTHMRTPEHGLLVGNAGKGVILI